MPTREILNRASQADAWELDSLRNDITEEVGHLQAMEDTRMNQKE